MGVSFLVAGLVLTKLAPTECPDGCIKETCTETGYNGGERYTREYPCNCDGKCKDDHPKNSRAALFEGLGIMFYIFCAITLALGCFLIWLNGRARNQQALHPFPAVPPPLPASYTSVPTTGDIGQLSVPYATAGVPQTSYPMQNSYHPTQMPSSPTPNSYSAMMVPSPQQQLVAPPQQQLMVPTPSLHPQQPVAYVQPTAASTTQLYVTTDASGAPVYFYA